MIIVAIIALAGVVIAALYAILQTLPAMPSEVFSTITSVATYLAQGMKFLNVFVSVSLLQTLLGITFTVEAIIYGYKFVMWVSKKIPMFGVSD